jgi:hypothetical protein
MSAVSNDDMDLVMGGKDQLKKSKRAKIVLILVIVVLVLALGALGYLGYKIFTDNMQQPSTPAANTPSDFTTAVDDSSVPGVIEITTTNIPNLAQLFGLSVDEVTAILGTQFQLKSSTPLTDPLDANVSQLATFVYTPEVTGEAAASTNITLPTETIYASLNAEGKVISIYYVCDLKLLGYPQEPFTSLLADEDIIIESLTAAGVSPRDFVFEVPSESSIIYDNAQSANPKIVKQTQIYSGRTTSEANPTAWTLTITYDYGISGVTSTDEFRKATSTVNLKLA